MCAPAGDAALPGGYTRLGLEEHGVKIRKIFQLQPRNFLSDKSFDRLQRGQFLAVHQGERVADILRAASAADAMHVIFRMLRHIVIDDVTHAGDVESRARRCRSRP